MGVAGELLLLWSLVRLSKAIQKSARCNKMKKSLFLLLSLSACGTGDILSSSSSTTASSSVDNSVSTQTGITDCSVKCSLNADGLVEATHSCNGSQQLVEEFTFVPPECQPTADSSVEAPADTVASLEPTPEPTFDLHAGAL